MNTQTELTDVVSELRPYQVEALGIMFKTATNTQRGRIVQVPERYNTQIRDVVERIFADEYTPFQDSDLYLITHEAFNKTSKALQETYK